MTLTRTVDNWDRNLDEDTNKEAAAKSLIGKRIRRDIRKKLSKGTRGTKGTSVYNWDEELVGTKTVVKVIGANVVLPTKLTKLSVPNGVSRVAKRASVYDWDKRSISNDTSSNN